MIQECMKNVGLNVDELLDKRPHELSGGSTTKDRDCSGPAYQSRCSHRRRADVDDRHVPAELEFLTCC